MKSYRSGKSHSNCYMCGERSFFSTGGSFDAGSESSCCTCSTESFSANGNKKRWETVIAIPDAQDDKIVGSSSNLYSLHKPEKITPISQELLNEIVAKLRLSRHKAEMLHSFLKMGNNLAPAVEVTRHRKRPEYFKSFFMVNDRNTIGYCINVRGLVNEMGIKYIPSDWRLYIAHSKETLRMALLDKTNTKPSIPIAFSTSQSCIHDTIKFVLEILRYDTHKWCISSDPSVASVLRGVLHPHSSSLNPCFLCWWDKHEHNQYEKHHWPERHSDENVNGYEPLVPCDKLLISAHEMQRDIVTPFLRWVVCQQKEVLDCLKRIFPELPELLLKAGFLEPSELQELIKSDEFNSSMIGNACLMWSTIKKVLTNFLGGHRDENYREIVENMLKYFEKIDVHLNLTIHFLHHHLDYFNKHLVSKSDEYGQQFYEANAPLESVNDGGKLNSLLSELCLWSYEKYSFEGENSIFADDDDVD